MSLVNTKRPLPPEIWSPIFAYATFIPGAFTHSDDQAFTAFTRDSHGISLRRRHREATDTMLAASLVCKQWTYLAAEFLFEYVLIKSGSHARKVSTALDRYAQKYGTDSPGRWTRRLELALEGVHAWEDTFTTALACIFAACPHIIVFSTAFSTVNSRLLRSSSFKAAMQLIGCQRSIRRLELQGDLALFEEVLPSTGPSLELLWLLPLARERLWLDGSEPIHFSCLRVLVFTGGWAPPPPRWTTPVLRTLYVDADSLSSESSSNMETFLKTHGVHIQHIYMGCLYTLDFNSCPNLTGCTIPYDALHDARELFALTMASLRRMTFTQGVYGFNKVGPESFLALSRWVAHGSLIGEFPSLEAIRFLLPRKRGIWPLHPRKRWEQALKELTEQCKDMGLTLETSVGADEHSADVWRPLDVRRVLNIVS